MIAGVPPKAYVAVYRSYLPKQSLVDQTLAAPECDESLRTLIQHWHGWYYDWGDDPSFFAAERFLRNVRRASWGVCRHDVRSRVNKGDLIVFVCAKRAETEDWRYHYIGYAIVKEVIKHSDIWTDERYMPYRRFYNLLIRGKEMEHYEVFYRWHKSWAKRCDRNRRGQSYVLFDSFRSHFNLKNPLKVAIRRRQVEESWLFGNRLVRHLHKLLFKGHRKRQSLRTSKWGYGHPILNLKVRDQAELERLRKALHKIAVVAQTLPPRKSAYGGQGREIPKSDGVLKQHRRATVSTC